MMMLKTIMGSARRTLNRAVSERALQNTIVKGARLRGWLIFHASDRKPSAENKDFRALEKGFPDLVLCRGGVLIFAELKTQSGRLDDEQIRWRVELEQVEAYANGRVLYRLWRPDDLDGEIIPLLETGVAA